MWLASEVPERVKRLVLCCTAASFDPDAYRSRAQRVREHGVSGVAEAALERWFTPEFRATRPDVVEWAGRMLIETPPEGKLKTAAVIRQTSSTTKPSLISSAPGRCRSRKGT